jgi:hypothetical protein
VSMPGRACRRRAMPTGGSELRDRGRRGWSWVVDAWADRVRKPRWNRRG